MSEDLTHLCRRIEHLKFLVEEREKDIAVLEKALRECKEAQRDAARE